MNTVARPDTGRIMQWLATVTDPEIPVLSIVDLGIVRGVAWHGDTCVVTITPTYSGCPAMQEITQAIETTLHAQGIAGVRVDISLRDTWTTDWITPAGRQALSDYGIAPPGEQAAGREQVIDITGISRRRQAPAVPCPQCGSSATQLVSLFGSTSCKALYRCRQCGEPFDYFKAH